MNGTLIIRPMNANLTRNTDLLRKMDPYVKVILGAQTRQTSVDRKAGKHPAWRDELQIKKSSNDDILNFEVWDEDTAKKDDFVGSGALAIASIIQKGNRVQEWVQVSYKGKSAGQVLVDITFIPEKGPKMMQNMPNMMPNTFPMMSAQQPVNQMTQQPLNQMVQQPVNQMTQQPVNQMGGYTAPIQNQGGFIQQQQIPTQQTQYQQPNLVHQNTYSNQGHIPQGYPQQVQVQQGFPQQTQVQIPIQQNYLQQQQQQMYPQPVNQVDAFAPPIDKANTINRNQLRVGTQINQGQGGMYPQQGNPNPYSHHLPPQC